MYKTIVVSESSPFCLMVTIHRPERRNSINSELLRELNSVISQAERMPECRFIVLRGENGIFCTGMDFQEVIQNEGEEQRAGGEQSTDSGFSSEYMELLKRFTTTSLIIITMLDGEVLAGGVGIAAASDIVLSTGRTHFSLPEALWGLLPACVTPFLIRRVGFQKTYFMTLTTQSISAAEAHRIGLVDELTDTPQESLKRLMLRLRRVEEGTVKDLKNYFEKMWFMTKETRDLAVAEITRLTNKPEVKLNIRNFTLHRQFPWENKQAGGE